MAGAPKENTNAEKWTEEKAVEIFEKALTMSDEQEKFTLKAGKNQVVTATGYKYDFIGELARELKIYHHLFGYLVKKFPSLKDIYKRLMNNMESNCFYNTKKGFIREATGIVNLKSNHKWTDRLDHTTQDDSVNYKPIQINFGTFDHDEPKDETDDSTES